jgi:hypothetical protein
LLIDTALRCCFAINQTDINEKWENNMGEARRRRLAAASRTLHPVPHDIRDDIAKAVRTVDFVSGGGNCAMRMAVGLSVLKSLGFKVHVRVGGLVHRVGPHEEYDVRAMAGPGNFGQMVHGRFNGHMWLESDGDLIDFSAADWLRDHETIGTNLIHAGQGDLPPINWTAPPPPDYVWEPAEPLRARWRFNESPPFGEFWYCPWNKEYGPPQAPDMTAINDVVRMVTPSVVRAMVECDLPERVKAWRAQR